MRIKILLLAFLGGNMKKSILAFAIFTALCAFGFSERCWHFESGSRDLGGKVFGRVSIINKTGEDIDVLGGPLENESKGLYFEDSILISGRGGCDYCDAIYSIDDRHLQIVICPRGTYELESGTHILPPMRSAHRNHSSRHHRRRYDHGPAPRRVEPNCAPQNPLRHHDEYYEGCQWHHDYAPNQNEMRLDSPQETPRASRPKNPRKFTPK